MDGSFNSRNIKQNIQSYSHKGTLKKLLFMQIPQKILIFSRCPRFRGIHKETFYSHLKECEFRYNYGKENFYKLLLGIIKKSPLQLS